MADEKIQVRFHKPDSGPYAGKWISESNFMGVSTVMICEAAASAALEAELARHVAEVEDDEEVAIAKSAEDVRARKAARRRAEQEALEAEAKLAEARAKLNQ